MSNESEKLAALERVLELANSVSHDEDGIHPWESELKLEELALAAKAWVYEIDQGDVKPVGWDNHPRTDTPAPAQEPLEES